MPTVSSIKLLVYFVCYFTNSIEYSDDIEHIFVFVFLPYRNNTIQNFVQWFFNASHD